MIDISREVALINSSIYGSEIRDALAIALEKLVNADTNVQTSEELTRSEYDALTTEQKNNGKIYFVTDTQEIFKDSVQYCGDGGGSSSITYVVFDYSSLDDVPPEAETYRYNAAGIIVNNAVSNAAAPPYSIVTMCSSDQSANIWFQFTFSTGDILTCSGTNSNEITYTLTRSDESVSTFTISGSEYGVDMFPRQFSYTNSIFTLYFFNDELRITIS